MKPEGENTTDNKRLTFIGLSKEHLNALTSNRERVLSVIPEILDRFYDHIGQFPETKSFFKDQAHIEHAKAAQIRHWGIILDGRFDEDYVRSVTAIGEVHNKLGLEPRWYIGAYSFLICGLCDTIARSKAWQAFNKKSGEDNKRLRSAIVKAAMLDMDLALSVYIEAGKRDRRETIQRLSADFESSIVSSTGQLTAATDKLADASVQLTSATERTRTEADTVSLSSQDAANNVQTVAAAAEELAASVTEIGRQVTESYEISDTAVAQSSVAIESVTSLTQAVNRVGEIVGLINDIAEKTNLLALNATIEAARAGEAGKGFAVVAAEVKELAGQTAKATSEIGDQIEDIQGATDQSASAIDSVNQTIARMNEISASIAAAVEQQKEATGEISKSVQAASSGTQSVTGSIAGITEASTQVTGVTDIVRTSAEDLGRHTDTLRTDAQQFMKILAQAAN
ncbi:globin-coupled sensor protein [Roseibium aggregatum]|uniref:Globin-coupled sensor protein n=1 Tax=Roseibium aggregatum TaxID=187304 RepID=A0A926NXH6_9HYPH|nr:globin-coupled sensor protein [Roseibium aggregatum]MBD1545568.1 globin-coupled sensor protein [Roseibium aggregatum]